MELGTKSLLFGAHQFILHPILVALAWIKLYGFTWNPRIWVAFIVHDWGYWGKPNMDGDEGKTHPETGAKIMHWLFDGWEIESKTEIFPTIQRLAELRRQNWIPIKFNRTENYAYFERKVRSTKWYVFTLLHSRHYANILGTPPSKLCYADKLAFVLTPNLLYLLMGTCTGEIQEYMKHAIRKTPNKLLWLYRAKTGTLEFVFDKKQVLNDPLKVLREDTYSNEETNEMTGKLIREQYAKENNLPTSTSQCSRVK